MRDKYRTLHFVAILVNTTWFLAVCCTAGSSILVTPWFLSAIGVIFIAVGSSGAARYPPPWIGLTGSKGTEDQALRTWLDDSSLGCVYRVPAVAVTLAMLWRLTLTFVWGLFNMMFDQPMWRCEFPSSLHSLHMHALPAPQRPPSARSGSGRSRKLEALPIPKSCCSVFMSSGRKIGKSSWLLWRPASSRNGPGRRERLWSSSTLLLPPQEEARRPVDRISSTASAGSRGRPPLSRESRAARIAPSS